MPFEEHLEAVGPLVRTSWRSCVPEVDSKAGLERLMSVLKRCEPDAFKHVTKVPRRWEHRRPGSSWKATTQLSIVSCNALKNRLNRHKGQLILPGVLENCQKHSSHDRRRPPKQLQKCHALARSTCTHRRACLPGILLEVARARGQRRDGGTPSASVLRRRRGSAGAE